MWGVYYIFSQIFALSLSLIWRQKIYIQYFYELLIVILFFSHQWACGASEWSRIIMASHLASHHVSFNLLSNIFYIIKHVSNENKAFLIRYILIWMLKVSTPNFIRFQVLLNSCKSLSEFKCSLLFEPTLALKLWFF